MKRSDRRKRLEDAKLYLLFTPFLCRGNPFDVLEAAIRGGVDVVQIRAKEATSKELLQLTLEAKKLIQDRTLLLVNDRADIAMLADVDGVHLGQEDLPLSVVRKIIGPDRLIGLSTHSLSQIKAAQLAKADYLGFGPIFPTQTKGYAHGIGEKELAKLSKLPKLPIFLLGGINPINLVRLKYAKRIAVSSAILSASNPKEVAKTLKRKLEN